MRTKVLLCAAALAASLASSMAQNVYSLNVVGYYNVTAYGGFTLCANQLNTGTNGIAQVLPSPAEGALVLTWKNNDYNTDIASGGAWFDNGTGEPSATQLNPGAGWFFFNPGTTTQLTLVGEVPQGTALTVPLQAGNGLVGTYTPTLTPLNVANNFPLAEGMLYIRFDNVINDYITSIASGGSWFDNGTGDPIADPAPAVGQGYFIFNPGTATSWVRSFTVQ